MGYRRESFMSSNPNKEVRNKADSFKPDFEEKLPDGEKKEVVTETWRYQLEMESPGKEQERKHISVYFEPDKKYPGGGFYKMKLLEGYEKEEYILGYGSDIEKIRQLTDDVVRMLTKLNAEQAIAASEGSNLLENQDFEALSRKINKYVNENRTFDYHF